MPAKTRYKKESKASYKKRMSKTGSARKKANKAAKRKY
jgi:hypothetical protein